MALGIINEFMPNDAIALGSAGSLPGDMQRLFRPKDRGTYHMEYGYSNMGYEVNGALGAKLACPDKEVYTFCGDGSFLMGHSELYTALQEGLKINVCLFDNMGWGCIENLQNNQGTDTFGTVFRARNPKTGMLDGAEIAVDFAKIAEATVQRATPAAHQRSCAPHWQTQPPRTGRACLTLRCCPRP